MTDSGRTPPTRKERRAAERASSKTPSVTPSGTPAWKSPVVLISAIVVIVGVAIVAGLFLANNQGSGSPIKTAEVGTPQDLQDGRSLGQADAPVKVDLYEDPQCPVCGRFNRDLAPLLIASYVRDGTVRLTYKDMVFIGDESQDAAVGMRAADQLAGKFWAFHDIVYENQDGENKGGFSRDRLAQMAALIGLDKDAFTKLLDDPALIAAVKEETQGGAGMGIDSTPTLVINGVVTPGLPTWEQLSQVIEQTAAAATSGTPVASAAPGTSAAP